MKEKFAQLPFVPEWARPTPEQTALAIRTFSISLLLAIIGAVVLLLVVRRYARSILWHQHSCSACNVDLDGKVCGTCSDCGTLQSPWLYVEHSGG
jgi:hypothetical protein